jgi:hypothetical protein
MNGDGYEGETNQSTAMSRASMSSPRWAGIELGVGSLHRSVLGITAPGVDLLLALQPTLLDALSSTIEITAAVPALMSCLMSPKTTHNYALPVCQSSRANCSLSGSTRTPRSRPTCAMSCFSTDLSLPWICGCK